MSAIWPRGTSAAAPPDVAPAPGPPPVTPSGLGSGTSVICRGPSGAVPGIAGGVVWLTGKADADDVKGVERRVGAVELEQARQEERYKTLLAAQAETKETLKDLKKSVDELVRRPAAPTRGGR